MPGENNCWGKFFSCLQKTEVVAGKATKVIGNVLGQSSLFLQALIGAGVLNPATAPVAIALKVISSAGTIIPIAERLFKKVVKGTPQELNLDRLWEKLLDGQMNSAELAGFLQTLLELMDQLIAQKLIAEAEGNKWKDVLNNLIAVFGTVEDPRPMHLIHADALKKQAFVAESAGFVPPTTSLPTPSDQQQYRAEQRAANAEEQIEHYAREARQAQRNADYFQQAFDDERRLNRVQAETVSQLISQQGVLASANARQAATIAHQRGTAALPHPHLHRGGRAQQYVETYDSDRSLVYYR